jgi:hypothetical protein
MTPFPFRQRVNLAEIGCRLELSAYRPSLVLQELQPGIDNVRTDVYLSSRFCEVADSFIAKLLARFGDVEDLVAQPSAQRGRNGFTSPTEVKPKQGDGSDFKVVLCELLIAAVNRAKAESNASLDLLARLAILKFLRTQMALQFNEVLERCRVKLRAYDGPRQANAATAIQLRERVARYQTSKKSLLRRVGEELFQTLREVEKESLARTRRSLFGEIDDPAYELFQNRLLFVENGRDDFVNAEHYVMLGNFERDPDRLQPVLQLTRGFLESAGLKAEGGDAERAYDEWLTAPENAQELVGCGVPDGKSEKGKLQEAMLAAWTELLDRGGVLDQVIAAYEVAALMAEYCPPVNPQQLKQALIWREERKRVEQLLEQHGKVNPANFHAGIKRVAGCRGEERAKIAGRFMLDLIRYYRDLRRMDLVVSSMDGVNLIASDKLRELSSINRTLYEFLLPQEQKPAEAKVLGHVVLKADIRDSSLLTRTLYERGLNPASYFSLNFYEPINKLLPKYGATKLFIEGDAVILALFEHEGEPPLAVARACVLACEMIEIVRAYNRKSKEAGLPTLELGIGICYQDSAPMYLMDGDAQIMISPALNQSDRLSSCSKGARKLFTGIEGLFNVYCFQTVEDSDTGGQPDEFLMRYNIGGINLSEAAFKKLQQEISLDLHEIRLPAVWDDGAVRLYTGVVPVGPGIFHDLVLREARIPHVESSTLQLKEWTERRYYEVCTDEEVRAFAASRVARARAAVSE